HFDVWLHAVIFHFPCAFGGEEGHAGSSYGAAVHKLRIIVNSHQTSPGALAYELPEADVAEEPRHVIAARAREFIHDHRFGAEDAAYGRVEIGAFARHPV